MTDNRDNNALYRELWRRPVDQGLDDACGNDRASNTYEAHVLDWLSAYDAPTIHPHQWAIGE